MYISYFKRQWLTGKQWMIVFLFFAAMPPEKWASYGGLPMCQPVTKLWRHTTTA
jgi:hypothetical protein